jgi:hypothetical protein
MRSKRFLRGWTRLSVASSSSSRVIQELQAFFADVITRGKKRYAARKDVRIDNREFVFPGRAC